MIIYISGPMTGIDQYNRPAFNEMETVLREEGHAVLNPASVQIEGGSWSDYMREDIRMLTQAEQLRLITGWIESNGARTEALIATLLGMPVFIHGRQVPASIIYKVAIDFLKQKHDEALTMEVRHAASDR